MEPIISPWFIYFLFTVNAVKIILFSLGFIFVIVFLVGVIGEIFNLVEYDKDDLDYKKSKSLRKKFMLPAIITILLGIFVPAKHTLIAMYVTKFVTTDNVAKAIEAGGGFKDVVKKDIIEIIEAMKGEKQEQK